MSTFATTTTCFRPVIGTSIDNRVRLQLRRAPNAETRRSAEYVTANYFAELRA